MDFVAGWLGKLDNFVDSEWSIHPVTGQSSGIMQRIKHIDEYDNQLEDVLLKNSLVLDPASNITFVGACHGYQLEYYHQEIIKNNIVVLRIHAGNADHNQIKWEFFVKTFLTRRDNIYRMVHNHGQWGIDTRLSPNPTNAQRVQMLDEMIKNSDSLLKGIDHYERFPYIKLDYTKLFVPDGSQYLCDQTGLTIDDRRHQYWNQMLPLAVSANELTVWGHTWRRQDYFN
jgi:hypothetical protein